MIENKNKNYKKKLYISRYFCTNLFYLRGLVGGDGTTGGGSLEKNTFNESKFEYL